jgi:periplasmic protein TonB
MALRKTEDADLRKRYPIFVEIGMIAALGVLIVAFRMDWSTDSSFEVVEQDQEIVEIEEIQQTQQIEQPPPPPRPPVPIEVPNDEILEDDFLDLDATLDLDAPTQAPPPPPPPREEPREQEPEIFVIVEEMPELVGGLASIQSQIRYPEIARKAGVEGRVFVQFVVDENGNVVDPVVTRGLGAGLDEEAIRAVSQARFTPGKQRGQPVRVRMSLPITFRLR